MAETINYGLYVSSDEKTKFMEWRNKVAGETYSNMIKIDTALKGKQDALGNGIGTTVSGNGVNVDTPVRGIITQEEYDALSEEEKNKGMYIISDGEGGAGGSADAVGHVRSESVKSIAAMTQTEYDALAAKDASTLYVIRG